MPVVRLTEIFRQAARSLIVRAAHAVNAGQPPPTAAGPGDLRDFFFIERTGPDAIRDEVVALASQRLPAHYDLDPRAEVLVVAPMHRGPAGIDALNAELRARLNADGAAIPGTPLRVFDRVIQSKNNHERELMNGEMGVIEHHDAERDRVLLACDDGRRLTLAVGELDTMRLAHAVSIHKAQGSQAPGGRGRPAPRPPPDAHAQPRLHGDHARRARVRGRRRARGAARRARAPRRPRALHAPEGAAGALRGR